MPLQRPERPLRTPLSMLLLIATCSISQTLFGQEDDSIPLLTYEELEPGWVVEKAVAPV